jgi:hypothetical protein
LLYQNGTSALAFGALPIRAKKGTVCPVLKTIMASFSRPTASATNSIIDASN